MGDFDVHLDKRGLDAVERQQLVGPTLDAAREVARKVSAQSGRNYVAVESGHNRFPRAAVFPADAHAIRSENKHHHLNRMGGGSNA